jgi:hypothetical protein
LGRGNRRAATLAVALGVAAVAVVGAGSVLIGGLADTATAPGSSQSYGTRPSATPSQGLVASSGSPTFVSSPGGSLTPGSTSSPTLAPPPAVIRETRVLSGTEPDVAASPFGEGLIAVLSQNITSDCARPAVVISADSGATWGPARFPWGSGCQDRHAVIAWGPGPTPGSSRLWAVDAVAAAKSGGLAVSATWSDNLGVTWPTRYVERFTPAWVGAFPSIAIDNSPVSPNYGTVYVAWNWLTSSYQVGVAAMATRDGRTWVHAEVPLAAYPGYRYAWRFGYRLAVGRDGSAYVSFFERDMRRWNASNMWDLGESSNTGRVGFAIARIHFDDTLTADPPTWIMDVRSRTPDLLDPQGQSALAVDRDGSLWFAAGDLPAPGGVVKLGHSRDDGRAWSWMSFSVAGLNSLKPSLALGEGSMLVAWHAMSNDGTVATYYSISRDGGLSFREPRLVTPATFAVPRIVNGTGLREAAVWSHGLYYYAWGDARADLSAYLAVIRP